MSHRPLSWLSHRLIVGIDQAFEDNQTIIELQPDSIAQFLTTPNNLGRKIVDRRQRTLSTLDYGATASFRLSDRLNLSSAAGAQYYRDFTKSEYAEGQGFPLGGIKLVSAASRTFGGDDYVTNTTLGFYWQEELSLNNRVFLTGAIRADENSAFGPSVRLAKYPKLSGSWVISEEPFWNIGFVDALKLRAAYGKSGLHPVAFSALRTYRPASGSTGSTVTPQSVGNPDLGPEQSGELEVGFEAGLLGNRLGIDFTYYDKRTKDMIILREIAPSTGFPASQYVNAARVKSNGVELLLRAVPVASEAITWTSVLNLSTNDSEVLELDRNNPSLSFITVGTGSTAFTLRHAIGYPIGSRFSKRIVSATFNPTTGRAENILCDGGPGGQPMACAQAPYLFIGRGNPKFQGGLTNTVTVLGKVTFLAQMDFKTGHVKFDQDHQARCALFRLCELNFRPEKYDPIDVAYAQLGSLDIGAKWFPDASFLKLRELSLTYDLPTAWVRRLRAGQGSISVAGRNLYTYAPNYTSLDPESLDFGAAGITNYYEQTTTPQLAGALVTLRFSW
jgi:outer membrane receptor protein involved in Fe transport